MALHEPDAIYQGYRIRIELLNYESGIPGSLIFGPINSIVKFVCHVCFTVENTEEIEDMIFEDSSMEQENSEQYRNKRNAVSNLWPGGIIPYEIAPEFDGEYKYTLSIRLSVFELCIQLKRGGSYCKQCVIGKRTVAFVFALESLISTPFE